jgi:hypothetical protein
MATQVRAAYDKPTAREREALAYMERFHDNITGNTLPSCLEDFLRVKQAWKDARAERDRLALRL